MSSGIESFSVGYNPINKSNIFTSGDCITGQVTLELSKTCEINSLCVKLKGKAKVKWTEAYGKVIVTFQDKEKYFSNKTVIIQAGQEYSCQHGFSSPEEELGEGNNNVAPGCHVYPFSFQIPTQDLPSSFKGSYGKIQYTLEANLSRSMRTDTRAKEKFTLIYNGNLNSDPSLMTPQQSVIDKKMKVFTSGTVGMDVNITRTGFHQGEDIKVVASIQNRSSREITPKYCLYRKNSYFAMRKRKVETKEILKEVGDAIPPSAGQTVTRIITIPPTTSVSVLNCGIIKSEYRLKVYLDVKYASDPMIKFPIVILPALPEPDGEHGPAYSTYGFEAFANMTGETSFVNPTASDSTAPPPSYGTYDMYPSLTGFNRKS